MGKKRRRQEDEEADEPPEEVVDVVVKEEPTAADTGGVGPVSEFGSHGKRSRSLVNPETATYLEEIVEHFKTLVDDEERSLLVGNVLEEIAGKEVKVAGDPVCSRHVETLMAAAQAQQLLKFLTSVSDADGFFVLVSSPFGSHVVEKMLVRLESQLEAISQDEYDEFQRVMAALTNTICAHLYDYVTDRFATHVVRRLLCLLAGRNVLPPPGKQQQQQQQLPGLENKRSKGELPKAGLASKLGPAAACGRGGAGGSADALAAEFLGTAGDEGPPCRLPELVACFTAVICSDDYVGGTVSELVYHPYACPFLQALLRAAASDRKALRQLVPVLLGATTFNDSAKGGAAAVLEECKDEEVAAMMTDPTTSHLVEVMMQVLPRSVLEEFIRRHVTPRLADLAHHPSANFVVQAALAAVPSKEMAKTMYDSLAGLLPDLLRKRRSGVVAALVACCGRHGVCQKEACGALASALGGLQQWANLKGDATLAPALLCLDSVPVVGANESFSLAAVTAARGGGGRGGHSSLPRLSPVGCSILIQVLRYGQGACRAFTDSVAGLQPNDAARVGADPSGSRVIEALLEGNAPAKVKGALMANLADHWDAVASTASGSFLVETAYRWADLPVKEAIVSRLEASTKALEVMHWGPPLLRKVGVEAYKRDPEQWRRHAASATKTLDLFTKLFGADMGGGTSITDATKGKDKGSKKGRDKGRTGGDGVGQGGVATVVKPRAADEGEEEEAEAGARQKKRKKEKKEKIRLMQEPLEADDDVKEKKAAKERKAAKVLDDDNTAPGSHGAVDEDGGVGGGGGMGRKHKGKKRRAEEEGAAGPGAGGVDGGEEDGDGAEVAAGRVAGRGSGGEGNAGGKEKKKKRRVEADEVSKPQGEGDAAAGKGRKKGGG